MQPGLVPFSGPLPLDQAACLVIGHGIAEHFRVVAGADDLQGLVVIAIGEGEGVALAEQVVEIAPDQPLLLIIVLLGGHPLVEELIHLLQGAVRPVGLQGPQGGLGIRLLLGLLLPVALQQIIQGVEFGILAPYLGIGEDLVQIVHIGDGILLQKHGLDAPIIHDAITGGIEEIVPADGKIDGSGVPLFHRGIELGGSLAAQQFPVHVGIDHQGPSLGGIVGPGAVGHHDQGVADIRVPNVQDHCVLIVV